MQKTTTTTESLRLPDKLEMHILYVSKQKDLHSLKELFFFSAVNMANNMHVVNSTMISYSDEKKNRVSNTYAFKTNITY